jgi:hypothetical protein
VYVLWPPSFDRLILGPMSAPLIYVISGIGLCYCVLLVFHPEWVAKHLDWMGMGEKELKVRDHWFPL